MKRRTIKINALIGLKLDDLLENKQYFVRQPIVCDIDTDEYLVTVASEPSEVFFLKMFEQSICSIVLKFNN
jgi:hypothetical protein